MWPETGSIPICLEVVKIMFSYQPLELTKWLIEREDSIYSHIIDASFINQGNKGQMYSVPEKKETKKDPYKEMMKKIIIDTANKDGMELKPVQIDWEESMRQTIAKGGCDIEILFTFQLKDGSTRQGILAVPLLIPPHDGSKLFFDIISTMSWQTIAFETMILNPQLAVKENHEIDGTPYIIYSPIFLWYGTGLKDKGDLCILTPEIDDGLGFLGTLIKGSRDADYQDKRRRKNLARQKVYDKKDQERREAAKKRAELIGDPMITEEELDELHTVVDIDNEEYTLWLQWKSKRIWEYSVGELLEEVPVCGLGLAFFAYNTEQETSEHILQQCTWKLRSRINEFNLSKEEKDRAIVCLAAIAKTWVTDDIVVNTFKQFKLI